MARWTFFLALVLAYLTGGCAAAADRRLIARNVAVAHYGDEVTGRQFRDPSNPVEVEVVKFAALTSTHNAQMLIVNASAVGAQSTASMREALALHRPGGATGLHTAVSTRDVDVPTPMTGTHEPVDVSRGIAPMRFIGEASLVRYQSWREVLAAETRARLQGASERTQFASLVQWPHGVHEIGADITLATILVAEDIGTPKAPIVVLDFLTRFDQRPKLVLTKTADRERAYVNEVITYTITFFNDSPVEASNVLIADVVDVNCEYKPDSARCSKPHTVALEETAERRPVLVWRLRDPVGPHEAGTLTYELIVRRPWVR